ncbi:MAG: hypothetical protein JNL12_18970 [Planctomycetes bacterium]|nr:hypothetical protein [Planctomycetota bacterium]
MHQPFPTKLACLAALLACLPAACVTTPARTTTQRFHEIRIGASEAEVEALLGAPLIRYASAEPPLPATVDAWYLPPPPLGPVDSPWGPGSIVVTYGSDGRVVGKRLNPHVLDPEPAAANAAAAPAELQFPSSSWVDDEKERLAAPPAQLSFETVRSMLEDSAGNFWFGSWKQGVCRYDGKQFTYFTKADGLADDQVRSIHQDQRGVVWFECAVGVSGFDGQRLVTPGTKNHAAKHDWQLQPGDLWFKEDGAVGVSQREGQPGAYRYDGTTFTFHAYPTVVGQAEPSAYATTGISRAASGRVWFATYGAVFGYDGTNFTVLDEPRLGLDAMSGRLHVRSVYEDRKGRLWIGNNGIGVLLHQDGVTTQFTQAMGLGKMGLHGDRRFPLPGDAKDGSPTMHRVFSIGEDREGHIWFGTIDQGAWRYDGTSLRQFTAADGLTSPSIVAIYTDRRGDLWLAGSGVFRWNGASFDRVF